MRNFNRDRSGGGRDFGNRSFGRRSFSDRPREDRQMFPAVCSDCGRSCEVPFEPTGEKPVYCSDCFQKINGDSPRRSDDRFSRRPSFDKRSDSRPQNNEALEAISKKLDRILDLLSSSLSEAPVKVKKATRAEAKTEEIIEKIKTSKKKVAKKK